MQKSPIDTIFGRYGNRLFQVAYIWAQFREGQIPDIFLQDYRYFDKYKDELKQMFVTGDTPVPYVSVHVRRGDYVDNPFYVDLMKTDYYKKAMAEFPDEKFAIFSDDPMWCMEQEIFYGSVISNSTDEIEDFNTMANCKGHIIANSSFSYWPAYLSGNKAVAPKEWFQDKVERVICPPNWIRI